MSAENMKHDFISLAEKRRYERQQQDRENAIIDARAERQALLADAEIELADAALNKSLVSRPQDEVHGK